MNKIEKICPICKGKGKLELPYKDTKVWIIVRRRMAKTLIKNGYSYRQVARLVGYGSTRSVILAMKK